MKGKNRSCQKKEKQNIVKVMEGKTKEKRSVYILC